MKKNDFYMVLPSNSSMEYHPENTASRFTTLLPKQVELEGEWAVGLSEIQFPCNFLHLVNKKPYYYGVITYTVYHGMERPTDVIMLELPEGCYRDITELIEALTADEKFNKYLKMRYLPKVGYVEIEMICEREGCFWDDPVGVKFPDNLSDILGFERRLHKFDHKGTCQRGSIPASLTRGLPASLFVYSDICAPYVTGDVHSSLLRIVPFNAAGYTYGATHCATFSTPHYIPLIRNSFRTIEIDIRSHEGELIPFQYGPLNVTLHFKRID